MSDLVPTAAAEETTTAHPPTPEGPGLSGAESASLWSDARKQLIRTIVISATYRQASKTGWAMILSRRLE